MPAGPLDLDMTRTAPDAAARAIVDALGLEAAS